MLRMPSRLPSRLEVVPRGVLKRLLSGRRHKPIHPRRILVAHRLLLGDTLMLTPLLARLRRRHPDAEIVMTVSRGQCSLYAPRPYGVLTLAYDSRDSGSARQLLKLDPFDLALVPGDNRYAMLAHAIGSRWVIAFADDRPGWKNRLADERVPMPAEPTALPDMYALLAGEQDDAVFEPGDWPRPESAPFELPQRDYAVLNIDASSPLRHWQPHKWLKLADALKGMGLEVAWCAGPGEERMIEAIDPERRHRSYAGMLDLPQLWRLLERARLLVCLDSGVSHLARLARTPSVVLYGPGTPALHGPGRFWRNHPFRAMTIADFPCRDQQGVFKRKVSWVRRCQRTLRECPVPACMHAIETESVVARCRELLG
jgi:ADP-heptose:LPS heptosyltransferase